MLRWEHFALSLVLLTVVGVPMALALPVALPAERTADGRRIIEVVARTPEAGGWSPEEIVVGVGEPFRLRVRAEDVVHGLTIAHLGVGLERIEPGRVYELDLLLDQPGRYSLYCDVWCSPQHYRMRGTLVVVGPDGESPEPPVAAVDLQVDPDAPHEARFYPLSAPSADRGAGVAADLNRLEGIVGDGRLFASESPESLYLRLRTEADLSEEEAWDLLAYLWWERLAADEFAQGGRLYARNCAACHGPTGRGDGPAADAQPKQPAAFADGRTMAGASEAILKAKIVRGGMGTGMPYWGRLFDESDVQALLSYLWGLLLSPEVSP